MALKYAFPFCLCVSASACVFSVYVHVHPCFFSSPFCHLLSHTLCTSTCGDIVLVLVQNLSLSIQRIFISSSILPPAPLFSPYTFFHFFHVPHNLSAFLSIQLSSHHSFLLHLLPSPFYLAPEVLSHSLPPPPTTHFSFLLAEISGWQMINIWPNHVGKFNAFSVISPQSSNICEFFPELRKSSVT